MRKIEEIFNDIVNDDESKGPHRLKVIDTPTIAQLRAIPVGADTIISDDSNFMSGPWTTEICESMVNVIEKGSCPHLHAYLAYLPPVPTPESALTAQALAAEALTGKTEDDTFTLNTVRLLIEGAVHQAREGMVYPPF